MNHLLNVGISVLTSTARLWRGTSGSKKVLLPPELPVLFDREDDPACRLVREALCELNLDVMIYPCPEGADRFVGEMAALNGKGTQVPFLFDPNTHVKLEGAEAIVSYLFQTYAQKPVPKALEETTINLLQSSLASFLRPRLAAKPSQIPEHVLTLYSFESSPYSRPVREKLCELQLPYKLVNLGKQQVADVGPARQRLHLGEYKPLPNTKRSKMLAEKGRVQVPFLIDPNHQVEMFESADILRYLDEKYT